MSLLCGQATHLLPLCCVRDRVGLLALIAAYVHRIVRTPVDGVVAWEKLMHPEWVVGSLDVSRCQWMCGFDRKLVVSMLFMRGRRSPNTMNTDCE